MNLSRWRRSAGIWVATGLLFAISAVFQPQSLGTSALAAFWATGPRSFSPTMKLTESPPPMPSRLSPRNMKSRCELPQESVA